MLRPPGPVDEPGYADPQSSSTSTMSPVVGATDGAILGSAGDGWQPTTIDGSILLWDAIGGGGGVAATDPRGVGTDDANHWLVSTFGGGGGMGADGGRSVGGECAQAAASATGGVWNANGVDATIGGGVIGGNGSVGRRVGRPHGQRGRRWTKLQHTGDLNGEPRALRQAPETIPPNS